MDPKLQQQLVDLITNTQNFVLSQAPDTIQQLLGWALYKDVAGTVVLWAASLTLFLSSFYIRSQVSKGSWKGEGQACGALVASGIIFLVSLIPASYAIQVYFFPKAYLLGLILESTR